MPVFIISYDLNNQKDYQSLWEELRKLGCVRALESVWIGAIKGTPETIRNHFINRNFVDDDDSLIVVQTSADKIAFERPYQEALDWVDKRLA
tara:strand:+ start:16472 stop:16747 length:276 start_codon:yes stop_codon:yes gene_type:complete